RAQPPGLIELAAVAEPHRARAIDDEVDAEIFFLFVQAHEQAPEALVDVPVDVAEVVAGGVVAVVGELDAAALLLRAPLGPHAAGEHPPADDRQGLELALEIVAKQLGSLRARAERLRRAAPAEHVEHTHVAAQALPSGISDRICRITSSLRTPSASPSKLKRMRWRRAGSALAFTSSRLAA